MAINGGVPHAHLWLWDSTAGEWRKALCDASGNLKISSASFPADYPDSGTHTKLDNLLTELQQKLETADLARNASNYLKVIEQNFPSDYPDSSTHTKLDNLLTELGAKLETADLSIEAVTKYLEVVVKTCALPVGAATAANQDSILTELQQKLETGNLDIDVNKYLSVNVKSYPDPVISQPTPQSMKHVPHGYYAAGPSYLPLAVDSAGKLQLALASLARLDDIDDVDVPTPTNQYLLYWDATAAKWKCKALVDADIPAAIARDTEVTTDIATHTAIPAAHHTRYTDAEAKAAAVLAGAITDAETKAPTHDAVFDVKVTADAAQTEAEVAAAIDTDIATHAALTTGVHGAGANHLALFPVASTQVTKFTPIILSTELWRGFATASNSSFEALINGTPTATSVVYDTDTRELSLPDPTSNPQWGKVILYNITRGNSRKITNVNTSTNTITTQSSVDNWANNDIITIGSQTCTYLGDYTYSRFFDIDVSANVPATVTSVLLEIFNRELKGTSTGAQDSFGCHPFETYIAPKTITQYASAAYQDCLTFIVLAVNSQKICAALGAFADINASGTIALIRLRGYWE